ncbi:MAG TPA: PspC domain-containing protein [Terracidiphilus sp.]|nr:PspC domain-containing protein [Terracidiphilus sp.]
MAVFCQNCATSLPEAARFCSKCGAAIPPPHITPGRPMVRPRIGRQIAGVCLALAQNYHWDVTVVRILTVLAFILSSGLVGVAYVAAWIGIPEEPLPMPGVTGTYPPGTGA